MAKNKKKKDNLRGQTPAYRKDEDVLDFLPEQPFPDHDDERLEKELQALFSDRDAAVTDENSEAALQAEELLRDMKNTDFGALDNTSDEIVVNIVPRSSHTPKEESVSPQNGDGLIEAEQKSDDACLSDTDVQTEPEAKQKKEGHMNSELSYAEIVDIPEDKAVPEDKDVPVEKARKKRPAKEKSAEPKETKVEAEGKPVSEKAEAEEEKEIRPVKEGSPRHMIRLVVVLTAICAAVAGMLAVVNNMTEETIAENDRKAREAAVLAVFPEGDSCREYVTSDGTTVYFAADGEYMIGYCVNVSPQGYSGEINMMVGIDSDGAVSGIKIVSLSETPGVGTKVTGDVFLSQFFGKNGEEPLAVGGNVDGIGGATFSSKAVTAGVNEALALDFDLYAAAAEVGLKLSDSQNDPGNSGDSNDDNGDETLMPGEVGEIVETEPAESDVETEGTETAPVESDVETEAAETEPSETAPAETEPAVILPPETEPWIPIETTPWIPEPVETEPWIPEPVETEPVETEPAETEPVETKPVETEPVETEPVETEPVETEPVETEPVETEPVETEPVETKPVETEPVESEPVETEPVSFKYTLMLKAIDSEGNTIAEQLEAQLNESFWIANTYNSEYEVKIGRNKIDSWSNIPVGYFAPDDIVFMVWADGTITTDNFDVEIETIGNTYVFVIAMENDPSALETNDETEEEGDE